MGPPPHPGPAMHSLGFTALHHAAANNNRGMIRLLVAFNADVNAQNCTGCAVSACADRRSAAAESPPRLPCRHTPLFKAAHFFASEAIAELLLHGADGTIQAEFG